MRAFRSSSSWRARRNIPRRERLPSTGSVKLEIRAPSTCTRNYSASARADDASLSPRESATLREKQERVVECVRPCRDPESANEIKRAEGQPTQHAEDERLQL